MANQNMKIRVTSSHASTRYFYAKTKTDGGTNSSDYIFLCSRAGSATESTVTSVEFNTSILGPDSYSNYQQLRVYSATSELTLSGSTADSDFETVESYGSQVTAYSVHINHQDSSSSYGQVIADGNDANGQTAYFLDITYPATLTQTWGTSWEQYESNGTTRVDDFISPTITLVSNTNSQVVIKVDFDEVIKKSNLSGYGNEPTQSSHLDDFTIADWGATFLSSCGSDNETLGGGYNSCTGGLTGLGATNNDGTGDTVSTSGYGSRYPSALSYVTSSNGTSNGAIQLTFPISGTAGTESMQITVSGSMYDTNFNKLTSFSVSAFPNTHEGEYSDSGYIRTSTYNSGGVDMSTKINLSRLSVNSNFVPASDNTYSLGASGTEWSALYIEDSGLYLAGSAVTSTAAELNLLDGVSGLVKADFTKLAAVDSTASELNLLDSWAAVDVVVASDSIVLYDATDSKFKSESLADLAAAFAGDGLKAAAGVLAVDFNEISAAALDVSADSFLFVDATDNSTKKESFADLAGFLAGDGLAASSGVLAIGVDDSSLELDSDALRVKALGIATSMLAADAVTGAKIADDAIDSEHIADGSIDLAHMSDNSVDSDQYVDGSIDTAHIADSQVTLAKMADNSVDSDQFVDGSIDTAHLADSQVTLAKMAANSVDSDQYVEGSIDTAHIADSQVTLAKMAANSVDSDQFVDGSIDAAHLAADSVITAKILDANVTNAKLANDSLTIGTTEVDLGASSTTLAGMTGIDFAAGNASIAASLGANTLTLGGGTSTVSIAGDLSISGDLTTVSSTEVTIDDLAIILAAGSDKSAIVTASGAGLKLGGTEASPHATFLYDGDNSFDASESVNAASGKDFQIAGTSVLNATTLGSNVVASSLTSVGTIATGVWQGTTIKTAYIEDANITLAKMADNSVDSDQYVDGSIDLAHMSANSVDSDQYVDGSIDTAHIADLNITTGKLAADAVTAAKLADNAVVTANIVDGNVTLAKMAAESVDSDQFVDGSIDTAHIADSQITLAKMAANSVDSDQFVDGSIDTAHIADSQVTLAKMADNSVDSDQFVDGSIDLAHMSANSVDSDQYVDGSIDLAHLAADSVDGSKIADDSIDSEHFVDGSIDTAHLADDSVTAAKVADDIAGSGLQISGGVLSISYGRQDRIRAAGGGGDAYVSAVQGSGNNLYREISVDLGAASRTWVEGSVKVYINGMLLRKDVSSDGDQDYKCGSVQSSFNSGANAYYIVTLWHTDYGTASKEDAMFDDDDIVTVTYTLA